MYGLPHSGLLANKLLEKRLNKCGYQQIKLVPGLWKHDWQPIQSTLVVDNFGIKSVGEKHELHLKQALKENYKVTTEWDGTIYIGITVNWYYRRRQVHQSLPGYTDKSLKQFNHTRKKKKTNHTQAHPSYMGPKTDMRHNHPQRRYLTKKERNLFNRSAEKIISRNIRQQHTTMPNQYHRITIRDSNRRNNEANTPTVGLHCCGLPIVCRCWCM